MHDAYLRDLDHAFAYDVGMPPRRRPNPFTFGDLALDEAFTDRTSELAELKSDMLNGLNVALIAPRRYGKTSLVRRAVQELHDDGVLVAEVDLMRTPTKEQFASHLARSIHNDLASPLMKAKDALDLITSVRIAPTVTVNPADGSYSFSFGGSIARGPEDIDATIESLLELPARIAAERKRRVALSFDEFQEVTGIDPKLPGLMRAVFQDQPEVSHVYAGSKRHMMRRLFTHEHEPFYMSAKVIEIGTIPPELFREFVRARFDSTDRGIADAAVDGLLDVTRGHPYATQELAYALWEEIPEGFTATVDDLAHALEAVIRSEDARFTLLWEQASRAQRVLLQALAAEPGRPQAAAYQARYGLGTASTMQRAVSALVADEVVARRQDGSYEIVEPFLTEWLGRRSS
jgi:AAA+ ATPase superfamily predicted ATPase